MVRRMSLCRMSFWATAGETPLRASRRMKLQATALSSTTSAVRVVSFISRFLPLLSAQSFVGQSEFLWNIDMVGTARHATLAFRAKVGLDL